MEDLYQFDQEFRDSIATVDAEGKRIWVYPKKPKGAYHNKRIIVTIVLLGLLFAGPFIKINGHPLLMLNFFERKFVIFGTPFWPQDFILLALMLITFFVFVILFTVVFGRLWCGWACPQTLFMEMVFRKIEYWIEGDANQQRKLNQQPWTWDKIRKKTLKQFIFIVFSLLIAHVVMAYLIGIDETLAIVQQPPSEHMAGFLGLMGFTAVFYWVFSYFREQACTVVCPYGRLQGVLLNQSSIGVIYDWIRGEPRGRMKKGAVDESKGDCIDCKLCVHACPTGIDIRNGTQLECVQCTACIDACDEVMLKIGKPKGLIRYSSYNAIKAGINKIFTGRVLGYSVLLTALLVILASFIVTRDDVEATILRTPGMLYNTEADGQISNLYNAQFVNKTFEEMVLDVRIDNFENGSIKLIGMEQVVIPPGELVEAVIYLKIPREDLEPLKSKVKLGLYRNGERVTEETVSFLGPM